MRSTTIRSLSAALGLGLCSVGLSAQDFSILYHEHIGQLTSSTNLDTADISTKPRLSPLDNPLTVTAFGRQFDLLLRSNSRLLGNLPPDQRRLVQDVTLYRGEVAGLPGSWVRFVLQNDVMTGVIWDGSDFFIVDTHGAAADYIVEDDSAPDTDLIIYRWSDTVGALSDMVIDYKDKLSAVGASLKSNGTGFSQAPLLSPMRQVDIGVIGDEYLTGSDDLNGMLKIMNIVDGIYLSELGVYLNVAELQVVNATAIGLKSNVGRELLASLASFKSSNPQFRDKALVHLFTGRNLIDEDGTAELAGIATLRSLCDEASGVGISEARQGINSALVAAHEIGHNFGAPHDNEAGSVCEATPDGFLMSPQIRGDSFSQCSLDQIASQLATATCLVDVLPGDLSLRSVDSLTGVLRLENFDVVIAVDNLGAGDALLPVITFDATTFEPSSLQQLPHTINAAWECEVQTRPFRCSRSTLSAGESAEFRLRLRNTAYDPGSIIVEVSSELDPIAVNNRLIRDIAILPDVNVLSLIDFADGLNSRRPNDETDVRVYTVNRGDDIANGVEIEFELPEALEVLSVVPDVGSCTPVTDERHQLCSVGSLASDEEVIVHVAARVLSTASEEQAWSEEVMTVESSSAERDSALGNNFDEHIFLVSDAYIRLGGGFSVPDEIEAGSEFVFDVLLNNTGPDDATGVRLEFGYSNYGVSSVESLNGAVDCLHDAIQRRITCEIGDLPNGTEMNASWRAVIGTPSSAAGVLGLDVTWIAREFNVNGNNHTFLLHTLVAEAPGGGPPDDPPPPTEPPPSDPPPSSGPPPSNPPPTSGSPPASGGGGGAIDPLSLALLLCALITTLTSRPSRQRLTGRP